MAVSSKIRALLSLSSKKNIELANYLGISPQSLQNKLSRNSFSAEDLIKIADFTQTELSFSINDDEKIKLTISDII